MLGWLKSLQIRAIKGVILVAVFVPLASIFGLVYAFNATAATPDEWACAVAIPLLVFYVLIRSLMLFVPEANSGPKEAAAQPLHLLQRLSNWAILCFFIGLLASTAALLCWPLFSMLDIQWAARISLSSARMAATFTGALAILLTVFMTGKAILPEVASSFRRIGRFSPLHWTRHENGGGWAHRW